MAEAFVAQQPVPPEPELPIVGEAVLSEADFSEAWRQIPQFRQRRNRALLMLTCAGVMCLVALAVSMASELGALWPLAAVPALLALLAGGYLWWSPRAWARQAKKSSGDGPIDFRFDDAGLSVESSASSYQLRWAALRYWLESDDALLVYTSEGALILVPKRAFGAEVELVRVLLLVRLRVRPPSSQADTLGARSAVLWAVLALAALSLWHLISSYEP